jgi:hypothetical protein
MLDPRATMKQRILFVAANPVGTTLHELDDERLRTRSACAQGLAP